MINYDMNVTDMCERKRCGKWNTMTYNRGENLAQEKEGCCKNKHVCSTKY